MFKGLREQIHILNADVHNVASCEKAKKLRKKLLGISIPLMSIGFVGVFGCFIAFVLGGINMVESTAEGFSGFGFPTGVLVPFFLIIPFALMSGIGTVLCRIALGIIITDYTTKLIDDAVVAKCPSCGESIKEDAIFCANCGTQLCKRCPKCNHVNAPKSQFCTKCGEKIN